MVILDNCNSAMLCFALLRIYYQLYNVLFSSFTLLSEMLQRASPSNFSPHDILVYMT